MPGEKYKLFRNFMVNELGISKEDIKDWTESAVRETAKKAIGQIPISTIIKREVQRHEQEIRQQVVKEIAKELAGRLVIKNKGGD